MTSPGGIDITLGDMCDLVGQQVDPARTPEAAYIGLEHIVSGRLLPRAVGRATDVASNKTSYEAGDVLVSKLRPYLDKAVLATEEGVCTTELLPLRAREGVDPRFLACVVHRPDFVEHAMAGVTGAQHPRTSWSHLSTFALPSTTIDKQRVVASFLWGVHDLLATIESTLDAANRLKRAAAARLFSRGRHAEPTAESDVGPVPESWAVASINDRYKVMSGTTPSRSNPAYWDGGTIPWVKTAEVGYSVIRATAEHITQAALDAGAARVFPEGTLLLAMYGQGVTRGKVAMLGIAAACNQACAALTPKDALLAPRYLYHFLTWRYEAIRSLAHGGQQQNLNLDIVRALPVAYPPDRDEQEAIVAILDSLEHNIQLHSEKKKQLERLLRSLLEPMTSGLINVDQLPIAQGLPQETIAV